MGEGLRADLRLDIPLIVAELFVRRRRGGVGRDGSLGEEEGGRCSLLPLPDVSAKQVIAEVGGVC